MDPVVVLAHRIRDTEAILRAEGELNKVAYTAERAEAIVCLLADIRRLYEALFRTLPTSLAGAGEQLRFAADRLPYSHAGHAQSLRQIAERFALGYKTSADLIGMRTLIRSLKTETVGQTRDIAVILLQSAADSVAWPTIVHRCDRPARPRVSSLPRLDEDRFGESSGATASAM